MIFGIMPAALPASAASSSVLPSASVSTPSATNTPEQQSRIDSVKEILDAIPYNDYLNSSNSLYATQNNGASLPYGSGEIVMTPADLDSADSTATGVETSQQMGQNAVLLPDTGTVSFNFTVQKEGLYNLALTYLQVVGKTSDIERMIRIDGKVPFKEARYITLKKVYKDNYLLDPATGAPTFQKDIKDNEIRPSKAEAPEWQTAYTEDSSGFIDGPLYYYLTPGSHVLTLEAVREPVYINQMKFDVAAAIPTYDEYLASQPQTNGAADIPVIQAEMPLSTSDITIYAINDRTSAITQPQDPSKMRLNIIGETKWEMFGQWIRYEVDIPDGGDGLYYITPRFKQDTYAGVYSSRQIMIDGKVPFQEASKLRFNFSDTWNVEPLNDGTTTGEGKNKTTQYFEFYLSAGKHVIEFDVSLGDMAAILGKAEASVLNLTDMYRKIRMITGATPDANRDYGFAKLIPGVLEGLETESQNLTAISNELVNIIGTKGDQTVILDKVALQIDRMANNTDKIAPGLDTLYSNIAALSQWLLDRRNQPLKFDYLQIQKIGSKPPRAEANFFQSAGFELASFVMSFFQDYNSVGTMEEVKDGSKNSVTVWVATGRDQAQIIRQMVSDTFTPKTNIQASVKLVAGGTLLPAVLAGVGPDVGLSNTSDLAINYAIRGADVQLNDFQADPSKNVSSFDDVKSWFSPSALVPMTLQDDSVTDKSQLKVFGLPEQETFPMMFYRKDVLVDLNLDVPQTWDDLFNIVPELQKQNLEVGITPGMGTLLMFMFQNNVSLYKGDGIAINLDDNLALDAFKRMCNLYTIYKFPTQFDFANRFRSGEMPIGIMGYDTYNTLTVFAPEIRGLWGFVPLPGTIRPKITGDDDLDYQDAGSGNIVDNNSPADATSTLMMRSAVQRNNTENAWAFMQWWVGADAQGRFGNEMQAVMGAAAKQPTANLQALELEPWPAEDYQNLAAQFAHLTATPQVPGSYIVSRYIDFAWKDVYNNGAVAVDTLLDNLPPIDKELTRKRAEFGMPIIQRDKFGKIIDTTQDSATDQSTTASGG